MRGIAGQPRGIARLARALGLDSNPLRRASDRAEACIRIGLVAVFLIAGRLAAQGAGHWAYHAEIHRATVQATPTHRVTANATDLDGGFGTGAAAGPPVIPAG